MSSQTLFKLVSRAFGSLFSASRSHNPSPLRDLNIPEGCDINHPTCDFPNCQITTRGKHDDCA